MIKEITVFQKKRTLENGQTIVSRFAKLGKNNTIYDIRFTEETENKHLIPHNTKPFVLVVDSTKCSPAEKNYVDEKTGEVKTAKRLYIRKIEKILPYEEPETDFDNL